jgi:putative membrane-bound dehydrogenase-like protein
MARRLAALFILLLPLPLRAAGPVVADTRLTIDLLAREPDIVTPTGLAVDERGRLWVIENNTHERPAAYKGPPSDRVRVFSDPGPDGRLRKVHTFADGFRNAMSLALGADGALFLATRAEIYRLRDARKEESASERRVVVKLSTSGTYPHNGLSGFAFDGTGDLYFSLGENLGADYKLIGSDGTTLSGGGEGGSIYRCRPDGSHLERVATGFWNTFHIAFDAFGRLFAVDNDPDARGPCRLLHIIDGGDYGYRFRNGRKGLHPFTAWNGELPGTLPMVAGTAEAPCAVVPYEATGLPAEYRGRLLVTSWGDHVIEQFTPSPRGTSFTSRPSVLVRGGDDFRPVAMVTGPDGALYLSDWVDKSYPVHGKGRLWRIRARSPQGDDGLRPSAVGALETAKLPALLRDGRRNIRTAAALALALRGAKGEEALAAALKEEKDLRARMHALWGAARLPQASALKLIEGALGDAAPEVRAEAARLLGRMRPAGASAPDEGRLLKLATADPSALVRLQALGQLRAKRSLRAVVPVLADRDPFLAGAALALLGRPGNADLLREAAHGKDASLRLGALLALRRAGEKEGRALLPEFLTDDSPEVRRAAIQWVAEERLKEHQALLRPAAARPPVTRELFEALLAARELLSGTRRKGKEESAGEEYAARILTDATQPAAFRALALRMLRPNHPALRPELLKQFLAGEDQGLREQSVRTFALRADAPTQEVLRSLATDVRAAMELRAHAVLGLAHSAATSEATRRLLLSLLDAPALRRDALRSLRGAPLSADERRKLFAWWQRCKSAPEERSELAGQLLLLLDGEGKGVKEKHRDELVELAGKRPENEAQWRKSLAEGGDAAAGERVFFHPRGPRCASCHRIDGRGGLIGPDLSVIARSHDRGKLIESILTPSKEIAPAYTTWVITTRDGKVRTGVIVEEGPNSTVTLGEADGKLTVLPRLAIEDRQASPVSLMPDNLHQQMTVREFRDLLAFLLRRQGS